MKFILSYITLFVCCLQVNAHTEILPTNELGKLIYFEIVNLKNTPKDSLKSRAINYLKTLKIKALKTDTSILAASKMVINKTLLVLSHPSGEITYNFYAAFKDNKYKFWLSDFYFIAYQRNRYGNFVASTATGVALEKSPSKANVAEWKNYKEQITSYAKEFAVKFKQTMAGSNLKPTILTNKKVVTNAW